MKKSSIPTIIALIFLIIGVALGVFLIRGTQIFRLGAAPEFSPKDVRISNMTDVSFTVSWTTDKETSGFLKWGTDGANLDKTQIEGAENQSFTHTNTITGLSPETSYFFKINSGGADFDNSGVPWQVKTGPAITFSRNENPISGSVLTASGNPAKSALVYVTIGGGSLLSTITSQNGTWILPISPARNQDLSSYVAIDEKNSLIEISVNAGPDGVASAQIYPQSARPMPSIILGQVHDFKNQAPSEVSELPQASIGLPDISTPESGFNVEQTAATPSAKVVTLQSVSEGEVISTTKPEFFGTGPSGTTITVTVQSDPITKTLKVSSNGSWTWAIPANLEPGTHTITITWKDAGGILRTLTRTFIVQASEGPAFVSTPSASPAGSPTPTPRVTPTPTASASATTTLPPTPETGSLTPTILLSIMGIGILAFSIFIWKKSNA